MAAFEFGNYAERPGRGAAYSAPPAAAPQAEGSEAAVLSQGPRLRSEPILALKIYDSCRNKICLGPSELGPALTLGGEPVCPPDGTQSVRIEGLKLCDIVILSKEVSPFRRGYWDTEIQYIFEYELCYIGQGGLELGRSTATNSFNQRYGLFGSMGAEVAVATDLFASSTATFGGEPFVLAEARAIGLAAEIKRHHCKPERPDFVFVTIGLFSMVKLYRLVSLLVESRGFVIPEHCGNIIPPDPCDFFEELDFPMDTFAPPQKREFMSGESSNIPGRPCTTAAELDGEEIEE